MTLPDISSIIPSKAKTWVGLFGALLTFVGPFVLESTDALSPPWPAIIGVVFALLTALGIYHAPYKPSGTTLAVDPGTPVATPTEVGPVAAPDVQTVAESVPISNKTISPGIPGEFQNPWKR